MIRIPRIHGRLLHIIGALLPLLLMGCSAVKTGYNHAPALVQWWLDDYISFTPAQSPQVQDSLAALHRWHRQHELPLYAAQLQALRQLAPQAVSPQQVCAQQDLLRGHLNRLGEQAAEGISRLAPTLQARQLTQLQRQLERQNAKWRKEWLDLQPADLAAHRLEKSTERAEDFYGRLNEAQLALLRDRIAASSFDASLLWRERLRRQQDMLAVLSEHSNGERPAHVKAEVLALVRRNLESPDPVFRQRFEQLLQENCQTLAMLHNSSTDKQRRHLADKLQDYENDVRELMTQPQ